MKVNGTPYRSLWWDAGCGALHIIDQRWLPYDFRIQQLDTLEDYTTAIRDMHVRGAPLIGATAAYGMALAIYHSGVEWHFWAGPAGCTSAGAAPEVSASDLLAAIDTVKPPSCDEAALRILGLSMAGWNAIASAIWAWLAGKAAFGRA